MKKFLILIPVYNDWDSVFKLIENIDKVVNYKNIDILIVNDASTNRYEFENKTFSKIQSVQVLNFSKNGGHREAIASGLMYCNENLKFDYVIPMDGDGEDRPEEINLFIKSISEKKADVIVAERVKRSENFIFKQCYNIHKLLTYLLTGSMVKFGNFTCLSNQSIKKLLSDGLVWLSFSGAVKSHFPDHDIIPSIRGVRYFGISKMSFFKLILHSFRILSIFKNTLIPRVLLLAMCFLILSFFSYLFFSFISLGLFIFLSVINYLYKDNDLNKLQNYKSNIKDTLNLYSR